jgi:hypothetical protein
MTINQFVGHPIPTGIEIFSSLYTPDSYRPLIGNKPGGAAAKQAGKEIIKWASLISLPIFVDKLGQYASDAGHSRRT